MKPRKREFKVARELDVNFIRKMQRVGKDFDINKGGYCDSRMGCINFRCGPDDKPEGWEPTIIPAALNYPRAVVGTLYWEFHDDAGPFPPTLSVEASPYELDEHYRGKMPEEMWENCLKWIEGKVLEVIRLADLQPENLGIKCPLCEFVLPGGHMLNDLIKHMTEHGKVSDIVLGENTTVKVDGKVYRLESEESFHV